MDEKKPESLSVAEQEVVSSACYMLLASCPMIPKGVKTAFSNIDKDTIGLFSQSGAIVEQRSISGAFTAQYPFLIVYRTKPQSDAERVKKEDILNKIAKWLCDTTSEGFPSLTDGRTIVKIEQLQTVYPAGRLEDGSMDYQVSMTLKYKKKGRF